MHHPVAFCIERVQVGFMIAVVSRRLLGVNFVRMNSLLVHLKGKCLVDPEAYFSSPLCEAGALAPHLSTISQPRHDYNQSIANFPEITIPILSTLPTTQAWSGTLHQDLQTGQQRKDRDYHSHPTEVCSPGFGQSCAGRPIQS